MGSLEPILADPAWLTGDSEHIFVGSETNMLICSEPQEGTTDAAGH